jgi:hypothetical protein
MIIVLAPNANGCRFWVAGLGLPIFGLPVVGILRDRCGLRHAATGA